MVDREDPDGNRQFGSQPDAQAVSRYVTSGCTLF